MDLLEALLVLGAAMIPIGELRFSIPYGIVGLEASWPSVLVISIVGNMLPPMILLPLLNRIAMMLNSFPNPMARLLQWRVRHLQTAYGGHFRRWGAPILVLLVAIPLPFTGAWTGTLVAWIFQIQFRVAIPLIATGVIIAGLVVTVITIGGQELGGTVLEYP
jgi:uncharacterized membrane protein